LPASNEPAGQVDQHAGTYEIMEDTMVEAVSEQNLAGPQTGENVSRVEARFESLDVEATRKAYQELNSELEGVATTVVHTIEQAAPKLDRMQSLLSQRGADRKKILKKAGLPKWMQWARDFAKKLDCTVRTIQLHIKQLREGKVPKASAAKRERGSPTSKPVRLDGRQQAALVKAQMVANDLVAALKNGADWMTPLAEFEKVAVTPARLDTFLNALSPELDLENAVAELVHALEPCADALPAAAKYALRKARILLESKSGNEQLVPGGRAPRAAKQAFLGKDGQHDGIRSGVRPGNLQANDAQKAPLGANGSTPRPSHGAAEEPGRHASEAAHAASGGVSEERREVPAASPKVEIPVRFSHVQLPSRAGKRTMIDGSNSTNEIRV